MKYYFVTGNGYEAIITVKIFILLDHLTRPEFKVLQRVVKVLICLTDGNLLSLFPRRNLKQKKKALHLDELQGNER